MHGVVGRAILWSQNEIKGYLNRGGVYFMYFLTRNSNLCLFLGQDHPYLHLFAFENQHFFHFGPLRPYFSFLPNQLRGVSILCIFQPGIQICGYFWDMTILTYIFLHFKIATSTISNLFIRCMSTLIHLSPVHIFKSQGIYNISTNYQRNNEITL